MIECSNCHTLNPDAELSCLACGSALGRSGQTGKTAFGGDRCPEGHPIDPSWKSCPYCERLQAGGTAAGRSTRLDGEAASQPAAFQPTRLDGEPGAGASAARRTRLDGEPPLPEPPQPPAAYRPTRIEGPGERPGGRHTLLQPGAAPEAPHAVRMEPAPSFPEAVASAPAKSGFSTRRLLAVLAAPDLGQGGTVFAVRGGRNTLGADRSNDIVLGLDSEVSAEHAVILHRNGAFHLADRLSTNGTWVNGEEVPANGTRCLGDRDRIRCGGTELLFLILEPAESSPGDSL